MKEFGVIKWYHDKANDGKYGFIENPKYDSLFFHKSSLGSGVLEENLTENTIVSFIAVPSKKHDEKWEATEVSLVDQKTDIEALIKLYFNSFLDPHLQENFAQFVKGLYIQAKESLISKRNDEILQTHFDYFKNAVEKFLSQENELSKYRIARIFDVGLSLFPDFDSKIFDIFSSKISSEYHYYLWQKNHTQVFPISHFLEIKVLLDIQKLTEIIKIAERSDLVGLTILQLEEFLEGDQNKSYSNIKIVLENANNILDDDLERIYESIGFKFSPETEFRLWKDKVIKECSTTAIAKIWNPTNIKLTEEILKNTGEKQRKELALLFHESVISLVSAEKREFKLILSFYSQVKTLLSSVYQIELLRSVIHVFNGMERIQLWIQNFDNEIPIESILQEIDRLDMILVDQLLSKARPNEATKVIEGLVFGHWETISTDHALRILDSGKRSIINEGDNLPKEIIDRVYQLSTIPVRIQLWLLEFHDILDFHSYKPYIITLPTIAQQEFLKKVLNHIHIEKVEISVKDFTALNVMDYTTAKIAEGVDGSSLDYSISILLNCIRDLHLQVQIRNNYDLKNRLFEIILNQIKDPKDILQIQGFFDECEGRASLGKRYYNEVDGKMVAKFPIERDKEKTPPHHIVCDGRQATEKETGKPVLDEYSGLEYWWCANQKCFEPSRNFKHPTNWRNYSIQDFLSVLKVEYKDSDLEVYLSLINKTNRFLEHLKCRVCEHILYPVGQSNYAVHGVNHFNCVNEGCEQIGKEVYLTHCLNGRCDGTIDSRDAVRCKPEGYDQETCGWYVCNDCHACCSTEKIEGRKYIASKFNRSEYKCHPTGHRNQGIISCNKCGHAMTTYQPQPEEYNRFLKWFIEHKNSSTLIVKHGENKFEKWWFRLKAKDGDVQSFYEKLLKYKRVGFNVPNLVEGNEYQMIAEPIKFGKERINELECENCGHTVDFNEFHEKRAIMKGYHEHVPF